MAFYFGFAIKVLANQNGGWRCAENGCDCQIGFIWLDCDAIWHKNATIIFFHTMMTEVFGANMDKFLRVFVDDLNVHNLTWEEHIKHLWYVFMRLKEVNLKLNPNKWEFEKTNLTFLGHVVS